MRRFYLLLLLGLFTLAGCGGGDVKGIIANKDKPKLPEAKSSNK